MVQEISSFKVRSGKRRALAETCYMSSDHRCVCGSADPRTATRCEFLNVNID